MDSEFSYMRKEVVKKGEQLRLKIQGVGSKGDFYGKYRNFIIFIKDLKRCAVGEEVIVEIVDIKDRCAFGKKI